jgi:predicted TPR repeat methyltransferase
MADTTQLLISAQTAHRDGQLDNAESLYQKVLAQHPTDPDALHFLGLLYFQREQQAEGIAWVRRSLQQSPNNPHAWNNLANMLVASDAEPEAIDAYVRATDIAPSLVQAWYNLGICYRRTRQIEKSVHAFCKAVELQPADTVVYERFGMLLYGLGRFKEAADVYRQWLKIDADNPVPRHMLAAMTGEDVPARADDAYLKKLFDRFSGSFDEQLSALGYRAPELLSSALIGQLSARSNVAILDAGCGTGLCGPLLRSVAGKLVGVDLSEGMVSKAHDRQVYDELVVGELVAFMQSRPAEFNAVISADTLVYFGALEQVCAAAYACLLPGGLLAFTLERREEGDEPYRIEPHGRYNHRQDYAEAVLINAGFELLEVTHTVLRKERGSDVAGLLLLARRA